MVQLRRKEDCMIFELWDTLPLATRVCITFALLLLLGCLLLQCIGGAFAERLQAAWQSNGMIAVFVLIASAEIAMIAGGGNG